MTMNKFDTAKIHRQQLLNNKIIRQQTRPVGSNFIAININKTADTFLKETKEIVHYPLIKKILSEKIFKIK